MMDSAWVSRFKRGWSDVELDAAVERRAVRQSVEMGAPIASAEKFHRVGSDVFLGGTQIRSILRELISFALVQAEAHFESERAYLSRLYEELPFGPSESPGAVCICGLSGVGKSQIIRAFGRLMEGVSRVAVTGHHDVPLEAAWFLTTLDGGGLNSMLQPVLEAGDRLDSPGDAHALRKKPCSVTALLGRARTRCWRNGVCLVFADEFQNLSMGAAFARATSILLALRTIGPRLCFCANYSLVNKLVGKRARPEDKRRLAKHPIQVLPDDGSSDAYLRYVEELLSIDGEAFGLSAAEHLGVIHRGTFGIKAHTLELLSLALAYARTRSRTGKVTIDDINRAYTSDRYTSTRLVVEALWNQTIRSAPSGANDDLWSPFGKPDDPFWSGDRVSKSSSSTGLAKVVEATSAIESYEARVDDELVRCAQRSLGTGSDESAPDKPRRKNAVVVRLRRKPATKRDLLEGAHYLDGL